MNSTREIVVTRNTTLGRNALLSARLVIRASHVVIDGNGATLVGPARPGDLASYENAGVGVSAAGVSDVTLRHLKAKGFATGLAITDGRGWRIEGCDFSDNYDNPQFGWGELPPRGGIRLTRVSHSVFEKNRANRVWNGIDLIASHDNRIAENDFSHCSNVCAKLWTASRNQFLNNNLSYGLRIDRSKGEVHARDSTCVLIESGSNENHFYPPHHARRRRSLRPGAERLEWTPTGSSRTTPPTRTTTAPSPGARATRRSATKRTTAPTASGWAAAARRR